MADNVGTASYRSGIGWNAKLGWKLDRGRVKRKRQFKCSLSSLNLGGSRRRLNTHYWRELFRDWADRINEFFHANTNQSTSATTEERVFGRYRKQTQAETVATAAAPAAQPYAPAPPKPPRLSVTTTASLPNLSSNCSEAQDELETQSNPAEREKSSSSQQSLPATPDGVSCVTPSMPPLSRAESSGAASTAADEERQEAEGKEEDDVDATGSTSVMGDSPAVSIVASSTGKDKSRLFFTKLLQEMRAELADQQPLNLPPLPTSSLTAAAVSQASSSTTPSFRTPSPSSWPEEDFSLDEFQLEDARLLWRRWRLEDDTDLQLSEVFSLSLSLSHSPPSPHVHR